MISSVVPQLPDALVALLCMAISFVAGVAWAAYRALDWADRIRQWALTVECPEPELETTP